MYGRFLYLVSNFSVFFIFHGYSCSFTEGALREQLNTEMCSLVQLMKYKEQQWLEFMTKLISMKFGILKMEYNSTYSIGETSTGIKVSNNFIANILKALYVCIVSLIDYTNQYGDQNRFFVTDLAIITIRDFEFEFTEKVIPICLPFKSANVGEGLRGHDGSDLRGIGLQVSGL